MGDFNARCCWILWLKRWHRKNRHPFKLKSRLSFRSKCTREKTHLSNSTRSTHAPYDNDWQICHDDDLLSYFSDIHCMRTAQTETFTAFLRLPSNFLSPPVLENVGDSPIDPVHCLVTRTNVDGIFALDLSKMENCGVRQCENNGEFWMCVTLRFPMLPGLKLPEDEVIDIKCKPQDPAITGSNVINFQENV